MTGDGFGMDCRGGNHTGCIGPPGDACGCPCHVKDLAPDATVAVRCVHDMPVAVSVPCPECKRPAGSRCITLDTHQPSSLVHRARANAWRDGRGTPLLTGTPGMERRDGATVDLAAYQDDPEYRAMIDARVAGRDPAGDLCGCRCKRPKGQCFCCDEAALGWPG